MWRGLLIAIALVILWIHPLAAQTGTQSDVTGPDVQEIAPVNRQDQNTLTQSGRENFERQFALADFDLAIDLFEQFQAEEFARYLGIRLYGQTAKACEIAEELYALFQSTQRKAAVLYIASLPKRLDLLAIFPTENACQLKAIDAQSAYALRQIVPEATQEMVSKFATEFRTEISNPRKVTSRSYLKSSQQLYQWLIQPIKADLDTRQIQDLVFSPDQGLRSLPLAALHDEQQFIIEQYGVSIIPSYSLTDTRYRPLRNSPILAFGISESVQQLPPLPAVAVEIPIIANQLWQGQGFLNQSSTLNNLGTFSRQQEFGIIHVATHAEFKPGEVDNSYIQLWDSRLSLKALHQLSLEARWRNDPKVELLILSACRTALGDEQAELGFAGLALQSGVKTAIGSLWYASDEGSLALMAEFYQQLRNIPLKIESLRMAQLAMLNQSVKIQNNQLQLSNQTLIPLEIRADNQAPLRFSHPYYWSAYTLVGNWN